MRLVIIAFCFSMPACHATADIFDRMDRVACLSEGLAAAAAMATRHTVADEGQALQSAASRGQADLLRRAYARPVSPNAERQIDVFASEIVADCHYRLAQERRLRPRTGLKLRETIQDTALSPSS